MQVPSSTSTSTCRRHKEPFTDVLRLRSHATVFLLPLLFLFSVPLCKEATLESNLLAFVSQIFVAAVLQEPELSLTPSASPAHQSYGTMGAHMEQVDSMEESVLQSFERDLDGAEGEFRTEPVLDDGTGYH